MTDRPNVLLIMTDQQRWDSPGYVDGGPDTPNLDALARRGVIFENAYCGGTSCVPARTAVLTGILHHRVPKSPIDGRRTETDQGRALREGYWTIAHGLARAGYETALFGKMHFMPIRAKHGFQTMDTCEHLPAGYRKDESDDYREWLHARGQDDRRFVRAAEPRAYPHDPRYHPTNWVTDRAIEFLEGRAASCPHFTVVSYSHPHTPYDPPEPYASMYRPEDQTLPEPGYEVNEGFPESFARAFEDRPVNPVFRPLRVKDVPDLHVRKVLAAVRALVRHIDDAVAELLRRVDLSETVVFFMSDHGDYGGHRGLLRKVPWIPFDDLAKVPFFVAGAEVEGGRRIEAPVQSFDFVPTAMELAEAELPTPELDSESLAHVLAGGSVDPERPVVCATAEGWPMVRRGRYKDIWHEGYEEHLLFDLEGDPHESRNLSRVVEHAPRLAENARFLHALLKRPTPDIWV